MSSDAEGATMTNADAMRASDGDRERVVQALQEQVGEGRLTLAEFEDRSGQAYVAKTVGELRALTEDLPVDPLGPPPVPPWQQPFPLPALPPWAQRTFPPNYPARSNSRPPVRRTNTVGVAVLMLVALLAVQGVLAVTAHVLFFPLPLLFIMLVLMRPGRRRYR
jgi:hypothetical protein